MATVDFEVSKYGKSRSGKFLSASLRTSGQDTITTEENLEDASGDIVLGPGEVLRILSSGKIRVVFGGTAATATTGHVVPANTLVEFEVDQDTTGTVSVIEGT